LDEINVEHELLEKMLINKKQANDPAADITRVMAEISALNPPIIAT